MSTQLLLIWKLLRGQRLRYLSALLALLFSSVLLYAVPLVMQIGIDGVFDPQPGDASTASAIVEALGGVDAAKGMLWIGGLCIVGITALAGLLHYFRGRWAAQASEAVALRVRDELYDHLQHLPVSYHDQAETGDLVQRCSSDVETLRAFLANQVVEIGRASFMLVVPLPVMYWMSPSMTWVSLMLVPIVLGFSVIFFQRVRRQFLQVDEAEARMTSTLQENLTGVRVVRAFGRGEHESAKFAEKNGEHRDLDMKLFATFATFWSISDIICLTQSTLVLMVGGYWVMNGQLAAGTFFYFIMVVNMYLWPVRMLGRILSELGKALVAIGRIREVLDAPLEEDHLEPIVLENPRGALRFDNVHFSHGNKKVIDGVEFSIQPGETVALLGPSGSGKSTIVQLLLRFYDPDDGAIYFDEQPIAKMARKHVRDQVAVVMQEPFLYSKTVGENIALGRVGASFDDVVHATTSACVHDAIDRFDDGYSTLVGERGVTLSGGQRQRVALARALLDEPAVLVLDDALSAVDTHTESKILHALKERRGRHTTILVAHRLSTLREADRIFLFDRGTIVQQGSHASLLAEEGPYRRIWNLQHEVEDDLEGELAALPDPTPREEDRRV